MRKSLLLLVLAAVFMGGNAWAASLKEGLRAYADKNYKKSYKIALERAKKSKGEQEVEALVLAGASAWEIDRLGEAQMLFSTALNIDSEAELPSVVKSKGVKRAFARAKQENKEQEKEAPVAAAPQPVPVYATFVPASAPVAAAAAPAVASASEAPMVQKAESKLAFKSIATYMPLGLNQLYQGKFFLGLAVGAVQGIAINNVIQRNAAIQETNASADRLYKQAAETGNTNDPNFLKALDENEAFVKSAQRDVQISTAIFGVTYLLSVLEAGINPPPAFVAERDDGKDQKEKIAESPFKFDLLYDGKTLNGISLGMNF